MKPISIIVAIAKNYAIGKDNQLLWHLPEDLKRFKKITEGHKIIMGKNTYFSLPKRPLPKRTNVVLTDKPGEQIDDCLMAYSIEDTQLDRIEVFASRFGRTTDFLINKVLRSLDACEDYDAGTPLDLVHRAEKRGLVAHAVELRAMKDLRNEIAHEYLADDLVPLLAELQRLTPPLLTAIAATQIYGRRLLATPQ